MSLIDSVSLGLNINVTGYAQYHSSRDGFEVVVPNTELLKAIQSKKVQLEETLHVKVVNVHLSYTPADTRSGSSSSSSTAIVAAVVSILIVFAVVATLVVIFWYRRRNYVKKPTKEEAAYFSGQDELNIGSKQQ
jgi:hypothetical protein